MAGIWQRARGGMVPASGIITLALCMYVCVCVCGIWCERVQCVNLMQVRLWWVTGKRCSLF